MVAEAVIRDGSSHGLKKSMIPIAKPVLDEREADAARRTILSGWITQGPEVAAFEREFAVYTGAPHACAVSNCTTALHLALLAAGIKRNDEVITVSHTYIATANAILHCGGIPVFVDIAPGTFNIDPALVEAAITPLTRAILCVHQVGMPCDLTRLSAIATKHSIPLIEDAACAIGSEVYWNGLWERIGKPHGDAACFSFHPRKVISTGDGGMLTTRHESWDAKFRSWRQHSMSVSDRARHSSMRVIFENYPETGFNYRMTDIQAAVGREQLKRLPDIVAGRRQIAKKYCGLLDGVPGIHCPQEPAWARTNWQSFCVTLSEHCNQIATMQALLDQGIATRRGIMCTHREAAYNKVRARLGSSLAASERAQDRGLILPLFPQMTDKEVETVASGLIQAVKQCLC